MIVHDLDVLCPLVPGKADVPLHIDGNTGGAKLSGREAFDKETVGKALTANGKAAALNHADLLSWLLG